MSLLYDCIDLVKDLINHIIVIEVPLIPSEMILLTLSHRKLFFPEGVGQFILSAQTPH